MKKRKEAKGQASFEYILTASIIGIMILPAAYLFYRYSQSSGDQIDKAQLDRLGRDIISNAEKVYYQGAPSRIELEARLPKNVVNMTVMGNWNTGTQELVISALGTDGIITDFPYPSKVNINGSFNGSLREISVGAGIKKIEIEAYNTPPDASGATTSFVNINFGGRCPRSVTYHFNTNSETDSSDPSKVTISDLTFFQQCYCNVAGRQKYRPSQTWQSGWFERNSGSNSFRQCMNADYNGDCAVDDADWALFCPILESMGLGSCASPPVCT